MRAELHSEWGLLTKTKPAGGYKAKSGGLLVGYTAGDSVVDLQAVNT